MRWTQANVPVGRETNERSSVTVWNSHIRHELALLFRVSNCTPKSPHPKRQQIKSYNAAKGNTLSAGPKSRSRIPYKQPTHVVPNPSAHLQLIPPPQHIHLPPPQRIRHRRPHREIPRPRQPRINLHTLALAPIVAVPRLRTHFGAARERRQALLREVKVAEGIAGAFFWIDRRRS
jgi:hypothetical protein